MFIHLPSFQSMGIDVKADISMLLTIFLLSLLVGSMAILFALVACVLAAVCKILRECCSCAD